MNVSVCNTINWVMIFYHMVDVVYLHFHAISIFIQRRNHWENALAAIEYNYSVNNMIRRPEG